MVELMSATILPSFTLMSAFAQDALPVKAPDRHDHRAAFRAHLDASRNLDPERWTILGQDPVDLTAERSHLRRTAASACAVGEVRPFSGSLLFTANRTCHTHNTAVVRSRN